LADPLADLAVAEIRHERSVGKEPGTIALLQEARGRQWPAAEVNRPAVELPRELIDSRH
jgi:hypothetical protein